MVMERRKWINNLVIKLNEQPLMEQVLLDSRNYEFHMGKFNVKHLEGSVFFNENFESRHFIWVGETMVGLERNRNSR